MPKLKAEGADAIVLLIHQGGKVPGYSPPAMAAMASTATSCRSSHRLDPAITTMISGHTHWAYVCTRERGGAGRLLTSAGKYGYFSPTFA